MFNPSNNTFKLNIFNTLFNMIMFMFKSLFTFILLKWTKNK